MLEENAVPEDVSLVRPAFSARTNVYLGYVPMPSLDRLMGLRDILVALKGPLASEPGLRENLQRRVMDEEFHNRVLGRLCCSVSV